MSKTLLLLTGLLSLTAISCSTIAPGQGDTAGNWPNWRGPSHNGASTLAGLPETFSKTENIKWVTTMPGAAASTPIVWGDKVFTTSTDEKSNKLVAFCLDRNSGAVIWKHESDQTKLGRDNRSNYASPSPATDGKVVVFFFGNGDLQTFDLAGNLLWEKNIQKEYGDFAFQWTFASSPLLHDNVIYLQVLQRDSPVHGKGRNGAESFLLAFNPLTGKELFKHVRPSKAKAESLEAFSTPVPHTQNGREEIIIVGGDCITGHNPATGTELWRWGTWNPNRIGHWRLVPSPIVGGNVVLACGPKGSPVYAVGLGQSGTIETPAWTSEENREVSTDVSTPLFYQDHFYVVNSDKKSISCVTTDGEVLWTGETKSRAKLEGSPTAADGRIYVMSHSGEVFVVAAGPEFKILHQADFGDSGDRDLRASVAIGRGNLLIRTGSKLYCIGN